MQVAKTVVKEEAKTISENVAIEKAILHAMRRHRISPSSILAVDVDDRGTYFKVRIYLKNSVVAIYADVVKETGEVWSSIVELIPDPCY